jgi:hypothetical protein
MRPITVTQPWPRGSLAIALVAALAGGCFSSEKPSQKQNPPMKQTPNQAPPPAAITRGEKGSMTGEVLRFRETTSNTLSNKDVGVSNIFERELPDEQGVIAPRLSAVLVIHDPHTDAIRRETVFAGNIVSIGGDRYTVVSVELGKGSPGWISLRQVK